MVWARKRRSERKASKVSRTLRSSKVCCLPLTQLGSRGHSILAHSRKRERDNILHTIRTLNWPFFCAPHYVREDVFCHCRCCLSPFASACISHSPLPKELVQRAANNTVGMWVMFFVEAHSTNIHAQWQPISCFYARVSVSSDATLARNRSKTKRFAHRERAVLLLPAHSTAVSRLVKQKN